MRSLERELEHLLQHLIVQRALCVGAPSLSCVELALLDVWPPTCNQLMFGG